MAAEFMEVGVGRRPDENRTREERIRGLICEALEPQMVAIENDSARHAGHAGAREMAERGAGGETHYLMLVVSGAFRGAGRVQRQRLVHEILADEFRTGLHALSLTLRTPEEQASASAA
ncbi:BolA family protein [Rhizosaccharibacter radicis]|uniref:BolA family transcriptional regulator n=1 Tax=Rhizosaccharibacter radicis TaxID=2782605 RepID=A0ABT1VWI9_9PROT|nr:BolA family transcriptional regulator [Acetobacteraceae bacterium KSS12]